MEAKQFPTLQQSNKCETHLCSVTDSFIVCLGIKWIFERFELFTPLKIQVVVFWVLTPCSVVAGYQRFRGPCCLQLKLVKI